MFDRFTDRARKVMGLARQEGQRVNHDYIGTEHVLLGLVQEGSGVAATVLKNLEIDLKKIRQEVERLVSNGTTMVSPGQLPFTPRAKKVLELSLEEASALGHTYIGTEHLLLGLIRENEGIAAQVLMNLGTKLEDVREEVLELLAPRGIHSVSPEQALNGMEALVAAGVTGRAIARDIVARRPGDPPRLVADPVKLKTQLGWTPLYENIEETIATGAVRSTMSPSDGATRPIVSVLSSATVRVPRVRHRMPPS